MKWSIVGNENYLTDVLFYSTALPFHHMLMLDNGKCKEYMAFLLQYHQKEPMIIGRGISYLLNH